jgi:hypothetical protein
MDNFIILLLIFLIVVVGLSRLSTKRENWYFNPVRMCLLRGHSYPEYWAKQYGETGELWPYRRPIKAYNEEPTMCGGCWSTPSPISMFSS